MSVIPIVRYFNPALEVAIANTAGIVSPLDTSVRFQDGEGLSVAFNVVRTMTQTPDTCQVSIANLDPVRVERMAKDFSALGSASLVVRAGYDSALGGLFSGDVRSFRGHIQQGADVWTAITADDGGDSQSETVLRISNAGMTAQQMIDVAAAAMGLELHPSVAAVVAQGDPSKQGPYAAVFTGKARDLLTAACRRLRCRWWIRDGQILLGFRGQADATRPAILIPDGAVLAEPETSGSGLVRVPVFLDPNIVPGGQVVVRGRRLRVEAVVYSGETRGRIWTAQITGRAL